MIDKVSDKKFLVLIISSVIITIIMTPWVNVDSLVIPKAIVLFTTACYLSPFVLTNFRFFISNFRFRLLSIFSTLFLLQMIIVMLTSSAPLEQQIFGRTGRGLGFLTELSLIVFMFAAVKFVNYSKIQGLFIGLVISSTCSSLYSIAQKFGFDIFDWNTATNGIIGTIGNPNFQSSIAAMAVVPTLSFLWYKKPLIKYFSVLICLVLLYTVYICQSTQGYVIVVLSICSYLLVYSWYRNRVLFILGSSFSFFAVAIGLLGMTNQGPLSSIFYKSSIKSRGEFWRTAISATKDNPIFGVGIDSFSDVSTIYKSASDAAGVNEMTDSAHNYLLHYSVTGGIPLMLFYVSLIVLAFLSFFLIQNKLGKFDHRVTSLLTCLISFQAQSMISPGTISLMLWNAIVCGSIIGLSVYGINGNKISLIQSKSYVKVIGYFSIVFSLLITYPLFNSDRLQLKSLNTKDALLAVKSAQSYPESSLRYSRIGVELLKSDLPDQALEVGRSAVAFNPDSVQAWVLILANNSAPLGERIRAKQEILRLDPFNVEVQKIVLQ